jgi:hypothetical protein
VDLDPEASRWFMLCGFDYPAGVMAAMGLAVSGSARPSHGHLWSHAATMVAVVTSIISGVGVALAANAMAAGQLPVAVGDALGVVVTVAAAAGFGWHQMRRWQAAEDSVPSLFPTSPGRAPAIEQLAAEPSQADSRPGTCEGGQGEFAIRLCVLHEG